MSDKQTFSALKEVVESHKNERFFIGVYPSGTHHGLDSPDLKYESGDNPYYNKFYNLDNELGLFINYFHESGLDKNTMLVITADHSTFPTPEFRKAFGLKAKYFVDQIPLIISGSGLQAREIDAKGVNSLSLTPTLLHLLGINDEPNYFLGCSLFDSKCRSTFSHISAIGTDFFETSPSSYPDYEVKIAEDSPDIREFYKVSG